MLTKKTQLSDESIRFGEELATITMGIDQLDRRLNTYDDDADGLVVINMGWHKASEFESYAEARAALAELSKKTFSLPEPDRRLYFLQACISLDSFCAFKMGLLPSLTDQVGLFLHSDPSPVSESYLAKRCAELKALFDKMGYSGTLHEMTAKWEKENRVPAAQVKDTMLTLMAEARQMTANFLPLPDALYTCETCSGGAFSARSDYDHLRVIVNTDPDYTYQALKHLVGHEAYPGHYMQFTLRRVYWEEGYGSADGLLSVCNHSSSSTFEGIADMGARLIGWNKDINDDVFAILSDMKSAMGTAASYQKAVLGWTKDQIRDYMHKWPMLGGEGAIRSRLNFVGDPDRAALIWSYWRGDQAVSAVMDRVESKDLDRYMDYVYGRLHTPGSIALFR